MCDCYLRRLRDERWTRHRGASGGAQLVGFEITNKPAATVILPIMSVTINHSLARRCLTKSARTCRSTRTRPRCRTCFTLYDQSRVAAKGPTWFEHFRLSSPLGEETIKARSTFPRFLILLYPRSLLPSSSPLLSLAFFRAEGHQMPDGHYIASSTTENSRTFAGRLAPIYALSIPIRATAVGCSSNPAIEWYPT